MSAAGIELRRLQMRDLAAIETIERRSYPTPWSRSMFAGELAKPSSLCLGAFEGEVPVSHLDLYRFAGISAAEWGDLEPYFENAVVFVEWPEAAAKDLPALRVAVRLEHSGSARILSLESAEESLLERAFRSADARP